MRKIALFRLLMSSTVFAGESLRSQAAFDKAAAKEAEKALVASEKAGTVSTQAQIDALLAQGKTKEALAAFFKRDATIKDAKAKAEKLASKGKVK